MITSYTLCNCSYILPTGTAETSRKHSSKTHRERLHIIRPLSDKAYYVNPANNQTLWAETSDLTINISQTVPYSLIHKSFKDCQFIHQHECITMHHNASQCTYWTPVVNEVWDCPCNVCTVQTSRNYKALWKTGKKTSQSK